MMSQSQSGEGAGGEQRAEPVHRDECGVLEEQEEGREPGEWTRGCPGPLGSRLSETTLLCEGPC